MDPGSPALLFKNEEIFMEEQKTIPVTKKIKTIAPAQPILVVYEDGSGEVAFVGPDGQPVGWSDEKRREFRSAVLRAELAFPSGKK